MSKKTFCIGLNKTGTSSLHRAFKILGLRSVHYCTMDGKNVKDIIQDNYLSRRSLLYGIENYDAYSDWDKIPHTLEIIKEFDRQYPGSKFILNSRDLESWLDSREKHVLRNQEKKKKYPNKNIKWLRVDRETWTKEYQHHYREVLTYFKGRESELLEMYVTEGDGWEKLCPFLGRPIPDKPFPYDKVAANEKSFLKRIKSELKKLF